MQTETVDEFIARGGSIEKIPVGVTKLSPLTGLTQTEHARVLKSSKKGSQQSSKKKHKKQRFEDQEDI